MSVWLFRSSYLLATILIVLVTSTTSRPVYAAGTVYAGKDIKGLHAYLDDVKQSYLVIPRDGLAVPVTLPAGRTRVSVMLRYNGRGTHLRKSTVYAWTGAFTASTTLEQVLANQPIRFSFDTTRPGPTRLRLAWVPTAEGTEEFLLLTAKDQDEFGDLDIPSPQATINDPIDANTVKGPLVLLDRIEIESLPPVTPIPEIANILPPFRVDAPLMIFGEQFATDGIEVWSWQPPTGADELQRGLDALVQGKPAEMPVQPPADAQRSELLDTDTHSVMAKAPGDVIWVRNAQGWSAPYLYSAARPFWISREQASPGEVLFIVGFGLRRDDDQPCHIAFLRDGKVLGVEVLDGTQSVQAVQDRYYAAFRVPTAATPGRYDVYVSNGAGGRYSWISAGTVEVIPPPKKLPEYDVTKYGANGADAASDLAAIIKAMQAATDAGGGIVQFPPGRYLVEETFTVPAGVRLQGAGRDLTSIEGIGYDPTQRQVTEYSNMSPQSFTLVMLQSESGLSGLTLQGMPGKGKQFFADYPMIYIGNARGVRIEQCRIRGYEELAGKDVVQYNNAIYASSVQHLRIADCDIYGRPSFRIGRRVDFLRNRIHEATGEIISVAPGLVYDALFDGNTIQDGASRLCLLFGGVHSLFRGNEILHKFRGDVASGEGWLIHGGFPSGMTHLPLELTGTPRAANGATLTVNEPLPPNTYGGYTAYIMSGRGSGQYRTVTGNTTDTLRLDRPWTVTPDDTSRYVVRGYFTENAWYGNQIVGHAVDARPNDILANVWERHRNAHNTAYMIGSHNMQLLKCGALLPGTSIWMSAYNLFYRCQYDNSSLYQNGHQTYEPLLFHAPVFANYYVNSTFQRPQLGATDSFMLRLPTACVSLGWSAYEVPRFSDNAVVWPGISHTIFAGNRFSSAQTGILVDTPDARTRVTRKTFILDNLFRDVGEPWLDRGAQSIYRGNRRQVVQPDGTVVTTVMPDGANPRVMALPTPGYDPQKEYIWK